MKLLLWKIIALFSILLGSLGPQVVSGAPQSAPVAREKAVVATSQLSVVSTNTASEVVVSTSTIDCGSQPVQAERLDLLLWRACDLSLQLGVASSAEVVVAKRATVLPQVTVEEQPESVIATWYHSGDSAAVDSLTAFGFAPTGYPDITKSTLLRMNSRPTLASATNQEFSDNNQDFIVLRC